MQLKVIPLRFPRVKVGDDVTAHLAKAIRSSAVRLQDGDVVALSSKVISICEGSLVKLACVEPSAKARRLAKAYGMDPRLAQLVIEEAQAIYGGVKGFLLTVKSGTAIPNAGIDLKNAPKGYVALWPSDPMASAKKLRADIYRRLRKRVGVLIVDSAVSPLRKGTVGLAIGFSGIKSVLDYRGTRDLYSKEIRYTLHNLADDLASAAHLVIGEGDEAIPACLIKGLKGCLAHGDSLGDVRISPRRCLFFQGLLKARARS